MVKEGYMAHMSLSHEEFSSIFQSFIKKIENKRLKRDTKNDHYQYYLSGYSNTDSNNSNSNSNF